MDDPRKQAAEVIRNQQKTQRELYSYERVSNLTFKSTVQEQMSVEIRKDITRAFMDADQIAGFNRAIELNNLLSVLENAYPDLVGEKYSQKIKKEINDRQQSLEMAKII